MPTITLRNSTAATVKADALVIGVHGSDDVVSSVASSSEEGARQALGKDYLPTLNSMGISPEPGRVSKIAGGDTASTIVVVAGLGPDRDVSLEALRKASGASARALAGKPNIAYALPASTDEQIRAITEGALLGAYTFDRYLDKKSGAVGTIVILTELARTKTAKQAVAAAEVVADAVNLARDLVNIPPNDLYPDSFAQQMVTRAKRSKVTVKVMDDKELEDKGYGGIMGVGKGSQRPPRLVTMSYKPRRARTHLALVGKGITFDSGGLSIKSATGMVTMKCDMAGAAAVAAAIFAIADLELPIRVTAYACLAENMPSGNATRPGDVLTMYGGKTVEVLNTDAEGRLVLADGITTAAAQQPDLLVDVATLTGACVVALGNKLSGVFSNDAELHESLPATAEAAGELMWPLPIPDDIVEKLKTTKIADLSQHNPEPWGGASYAAGFLREFVPEGLTWAHLDIAGPAFNSGEAEGYTPKGGTGAAVRTLIQLATERSV